MTGLGKRELLKPLTVTAPHAKNPSVDAPVDMASDETAGGAVKLPSLLKINLGSADARSVEGGKLRVAVRLNMPAEQPWP